MPDIKNLPVNCLYQHPDNPRKDLGDLTELADSIKANGIFQNLTVIPANQVKAVWDEICKMPQEETPAEAYVVIIGHRRLAAAKQAGIEEVPCAVASMTPQEQVRTMLIENMLRTELTPYEQAQSFQMMLDMGDTVETIAKDSGFSVSTVRNRVKLLKFDDKAFRDATEKQVTIDTLLEVARIENNKTRNKVLAAYGSNNFQWELRQELDRQAAKKNAPAVKKEVLAFATEVAEVDYRNYEHVFSVSFASYTPGSATPKKLTKGEYVADFSDRSVSIYIKKKKEPVRKRPQEEIDREREIKRRETELAELTEGAYNLRRDFVLGLTVAKADYPKLMKHACQAMIVCNLRYCGSDFTKNYSDYLSINAPESHVPDDRCAYFVGELGKQDFSPKSLLAAIFAGYGDCKSEGYWQKVYNEAPRHKNNSVLDYTYDFLCAFGYELSDVEKSLKDGTHPLLLQDSPADPNGATAAAPETSDGS